MVAQTSLMGWNSWDCYGAAVDEETVRRNAQFMAEHLKQYGWEYVVVDIQWSAAGAKNNEYEPFCELNMDEWSRLLPAENRFPSSAGGKGFRPLADYVHSLGLKFGIHIMRGIPRQAVHRGAKILGTELRARDVARPSSICVWNSDMYGVDPARPGAREYYDSIFALYREWGVDFVKCDDICRELPHEEGEMRLISESLRACGRDMVLSLSPGPAQLERAELYKQVSNMWRITDDFWDDWRLLYAMFERAEKWSVHAGAGHWPDADMLPIGPVRQVYDKNERTRFTEAEQRTMMTLWSVLRSPLMIGGEMTGFDDFTMSLVTNGRVLAMHRNARHAHQVWRKEVCGREHVLWTAPSSEGGFHLAVFNLSDEESEISVSLSDVEEFGERSGVELWSGESTGLTDRLTVRLAPHDAKAYLFD